MGGLQELVRCGAVMLMFCVAGCGRTPVVVSESGGEEGGSAETGSEACAVAPEPPASDPMCSLIPLDDALTQDAANAIFARTVHESRHLLVRIDGGESGPFEDVDDLGFMSARLETTAPEALCAAVRFSCWTGGHGSFGLSGLHGTAVVTRTSTSAQVEGVLGLVDGDALVGAPGAEVSITVTPDGESGTVGAFQF